MTEPYHSAYTSLVDAPVRRSRISVRDVANYSRKQQLLLNITPLQLPYCIKILQRGPLALALAPQYRVALRVYITVIRAPPLAVPYFARFVTMKASPGIQHTEGGGTPCVDHADTQHERTQSQMHGTDDECGRFQLALESLLFNVVAGWQQELRPGMQGYRFSRPTASTKHF